MHDVNSTRHLVLLVLALVLFGLSAVGVPFPRAEPTTYGWRYIACGLFFWVLSILW